MRVIDKGINIINMLKKGSLSHEHKNKMTSDMEYINKENIKLISTNKNLTDDKKKLNKENDRLTNDNNKLTADLAKLTADLAKSTIDYNNLTTKYDRLEDDYKNVRAIREIEINCYNQFNDKYIKLEEENNQVNDKYRNLTNNLTIYNLTNNYNINYLNVQNEMDTKKRKLI